MNKTKRHKYCLTDKTICLYNAVKERVLRMNRDILKQIIVDQKEMYLYNPIELTHSNECGFFFNIA